VHRSLGLGDAPPQRTSISVRSRDRIVLRTGSAESSRSAGFARCSSYVKQISSGGLHHRRGQRQVLHIPGKCYRDGADTAMESASCTECGEDAGHHEITVPRGDGTYELFDEDVRGNTPVVCECGSTAFDVEFEALCSYCAHMADKD
jgi:hypothetical protein